MGFLDKAKAAAEQAAAKAKEGVDDVQTKRELSQAYNELGKTTYELIESGRRHSSAARDDRREDRALRERRPPAPGPKHATRRRTTRPSRPRCRTRSGLKATAAGTRTRSTSAAIPRSRLT